MVRRAEPPAPSCREQGRFVRIRVYAVVRGADYGTGWPVLISLPPKSTPFSPPRVQRKTPMT